MFRECVRMCLVVLALSWSGILWADTENQANSVVDGEAEQVMKARINAYFDAYKGHDPDAYAAWLKDNRTEEAFSMAPLDARLEMYNFDAERWGGLDVGQVEFPEPFLGVGEAQPNNGGLPIRVMFQFEDSPPYRIGPMSIGIAIDLPGEWSSLDDFTRQLLTITGVPAFAIGVMKDGRIVAQSVQGVRQIGSGDAVQADDTFHWGSITKSVTGTMIGKLIENGVLGWNTTVAEVLDDIAMRDEYRGATLSQLMSHEAGIPEYANFTPESVEQILAASAGDSWTDKRRAFVAQVLMEEPLAPPGDIHAYSNAGITIAGYMAEVLTGKSWQDLVQEHVFDPAGMTTAGFGWPATPDRPERPRGHFGDSQENYEVMQFGQMDELVYIIAPAGNVHSSIADLLRYGNMHLQGMNGSDGYLSSETISQLHTPREDSVAWGAGFYTFGWGHDQCRHFVGEPMCHAHNGGAGSFYAELKIIPEHNMVLAYMANAAEPSEAVSQEVLAAIYERHVAQ